MKTNGTRQAEDCRETRRDGLPGIVIAGGSGWKGRMRPPRISAFVWGGKTRPSPTLPYGRWKGVA